MYVQLTYNEGSLEGSSEGHGSQEAQGYEEVDVGNEGRGDCQHHLENYGHNKARTAPQPKINNCRLD